MTAEATSIGYVEYAVSGRIAAYPGATDIAFPTFRLLRVAGVYWKSALDARLEERGFSALAESSFAEDWDSEADSVYDNI